MSPVLNPGYCTNLMAKKQKQHESITESLTPEKEALCLEQKISLLFLWMNLNIVASSDK